MNYNVFTAIKILGFRCRLKKFLKDFNAEHMPQDAFTIKFIAAELKEKLLGGKISKITQPEKDMLAFIIYTACGSVKLEICLSAKQCRVNVAKTETPAPKVAPAFCMLLRKHLQNARVADIGQIDGERIVFMDFDCTSEFELFKMRLYIELMGKYSNAILVRDGVIAGALKSTAIAESTRRILFTGAKYALPEPQDKTAPDDLQSLESVFKSAAGDKAKFISDRVRGVSYSTALDVVETYGEDLTAKQVYEYLTGGKYAPCVTFADGVETDFKVRSASAEKKNYPTLLDAQTAYFAAVVERRDFGEKRRKLLAAVNTAVKKLEKRLSVIEQKLLDCRDMELVKLKGELITANIYAIERGMDSFEAVNYYDEKGGKIKIALDKTLSPADNAQKFYKRYAKLKRTVETVSVQRDETKRELDYLNSINSHIYAGECLSDFEETEEELKALGLIREKQQGKKQTAVSPFRAFLCEGFKILAGRNNMQNDRLLKSVSPSDIWLHTQNYHSSHVVIITGGKAVPDNVLQVAAEICAYYSDGRAGNKIPVDYTKRQFVKKPPKSNAGFVIYTDYKTVLVDPDAHAGLKEEKL